MAEVEKKAEVVTAERGGEEEDQKIASDESVVEIVEEVEQETSEPAEETPSEEPEPLEAVTTVVKNATSGYGYNYASLADIAKAGVKIPKMRICRENPDFLEYWDGADWQLGSRIIVPKMSGVNAAQAYGSALTYARRYTTQMAMSVACDDDKAVENTKSNGLPKGEGDEPKTKKGHGVDFDKIRAEIKDCDDLETLRLYWGTLSLTKKQEEAILPAFIARKKELGAADGA